MKPCLRDLNDHCFAGRNGVDTDCFSFDTQSPYIMDVLAVVSNNGNVTWMPHVMLNSYCAMRMRHFPHDTQLCLLIFGSWSYDATQVSASTVTVSNDSDSLQ